MAANVNGAANNPLEGYQAALQKLSGGGQLSSTEFQALYKGRDYLKIANDPDVLSGFNNLGSDFRSAVAKIVEEQGVDPIEAVSILKNQSQLNNPAFQAVLAQTKEQIKGQGLTSKDLFQLAATTDNPVLADVYNTLGESRKRAIAMMKQITANVNKKDEFQEQLDADLEKKNNELAQRIARGPEDEEDSGVDSAFPDPPSQPLTETEGPI